MKTIQLTEPQERFLAYCLDRVHEDMANAGCNDLPDEVAALFPNGEEIAGEYAVLNNSEEPEGPDWPLPDFCLLTWLRNKLDV